MVAGVEVDIAIVASGGLDWIGLDWEAEVIG
jgi:hypothetical protein